MKSQLSWGRDDTLNNGGLSTVSLQLAGSPTNPSLKLVELGRLCGSRCARARHAVSAYLENRRTFAGLDAYAAGSPWFLPSLENLLLRTGLSFGNYLTSERSDQRI